MAAVLKWRRPKCPDFISFVLDENEVISLSKKPLGVMCSYVGPNNPVTASDENKCEGFVQINPRDFLASIQRLMLGKNLYNGNIKLSHPSNPYQFLLNSFSINSVNPNYLPFDPAMYPEYDGVNLNLNEKERIQLNVIKGLAGALEDEIVAVRETAASSLGMFIIIKIPGIKITGCKRCIPVIRFPNIYGKTLTKNRCDKLTGSTRRFRCPISHNKRPRF